MLRAILIVSLGLLLTAEAVQAQMPRERVATDEPIDDIFWSHKVVLTNSVHNLPRGNLNVTIMHSFGMVRGGVTTLFGMDDSANIRLGVDYGITDRLSVGFGRSRFDKLFDGRFQANLLRQTQDGRIPVEIAVTGTVGITTLENGFAFDDRLNYHAAAMLARQFAGRFSLQVAPMVSHFNTVLVEQDAQGQTLEPRNTHFALGLAGSLVLSQRVALQVEYVPVIGSRSDGTSDTLSIGFDLDTGGHVFQLFLTTSQWLTEQHLVARNAESFLDGDIRIGFNVNRVFRL